jgi:hypothetical protein
MGEVIDGLGPPVEYGQLAVCIVILKRCIPVSSSRSERNGLCCFGITSTCPGLTGPIVRKEHMVSTSSTSSLGLPQPQYHRIRSHPCIVSFVFLELTTLSFLCEHPFLDRRSSGAITRKLSNHVSNLTLHGFSAPILQLFEIVVDKSFHIVQFMKGFL